MNMFITIAIIIILAILWYLLQPRLSCIKSNIDGNTYCVQKRSKTIINNKGEDTTIIDMVRMQKSANLLSKVANNCTLLVHYMKLNYPDDSRTRLLLKRYNPNNIQEILPTSNHTAYSRSKGKSIAFCLNKYKSINNSISSTDENYKNVMSNADQDIVDLQTLTFVAIHELAHVASVNHGHKQEFWDNFKFLLQCAEEGQIYKSSNYNQTPESYCGMMITDNPNYIM